MTRTEVKEPVKASVICKTKDLLETLKFLKIAIPKNSSGKKYCCEITVTVNQAQFVVIGAKRTLYCNAKGPAKVSAVKIEELYPYNVITPESKASAHIDLIHESVNFMVLEQENWLPFLRISNSYNRSCALSFEIGFVRKLCSNGVMFNKQSTKLKYIHTK